VDDTRFDAMAKVLGSQQANRRLLVGVLLAGALGRLGRTEAEGRRSSGKCKPKCGECEKCDKGKCEKKHGKKHCKKGKCKAKAAGTTCTVSTGESGSCQGRICVAISIVVPVGAVGINCTGGTTNCGGACVNTTTDEANCGSCGNACPGTQVCQAGACFPRSTCPANIRSLCDSAIGIPCSAANPLIACYCARSAEGNVVCVREDLDPKFCTLSPSCTSSEDCRVGEACVNAGGCCPPTPLPPGTGKCMVPCPVPAT
jgi:hypothetical protein